MPKKRRFAIVGTGARAQLYTHAIVGEFSVHCELVALCDPNSVRLAHHNALLHEAFGIAPLPSYEL